MIPAHEVKCEGCTSGEIYQAFAAQDTDLGADLPFLRWLASSCNHITELGVRNGVSTSALLISQPVVLKSYDIEPFIYQDKFEQAAKAQHTDFQFTQADDLEIVLEPTDLLFIDTKHTFKQLKAELALHGNKARKFIAMHDVNSYGETGEDGSTPGLLAAILEFCGEHLHWNPAIRTYWCNGIMVLLRETP